jgi:hypothetical protein
MYIEGYGYGQVEDTGSAVKGRRVELFFGSHAAALRWGRTNTRARVWLPPRRDPDARLRSAFDAGAG